MRQRLVRNAERWFPAGVVAAADQDSSRQSITNCLHEKGSLCQVPFPSSSSIHAAEQDQDHASIRTLRGRIGARYMLRSEQVRRCNLMGGLPAAPLSLPLGRRRPTVSTQSPQTGLFEVLFRQKIQAIRNRCPGLPSLTPLLLGT